MCVVVAVAALTTSMPGMGSTTSVSGTAVVQTATAAAAPDALAAPKLTSACDVACVSEVSDLCSLVAGLTMMSLLALLLTSRRDTFPGLLARLRHAAFVGPRLREQTPWNLLSPVSLCVLRV